MSTDISMLPTVRDALSVRAILCAIPLGLIICCLNTYFGLSANIIQSMPLQSTLLSFAIFRALQPRLARPFTPSEHTVVTAIAGSLGLGPYTSGFTGFVPALQYLPSVEEGGPVRFSLATLMLWALAVCGLGLILAPPFRRYFILEKPLRFPTPRASGILICLLHSKEDDTTIQQTTNETLAFSRGPASRSSQTSRHGLEATSSIEKAVKSVLWALSGASALAALQRIVPAMRELPILGTYMAEKWLWTISLDPAFLGFGMVLQPHIGAQSLLGAVIGWGVLSPLAKHQGWAPADPDDWEAGSRGWIMWISNALMLGETSVALVDGALGLLIPALSQLLLQHFSSRSKYITRESEQPLLHNTPDDNLDETLNRQDSQGDASTDRWPATAIATRRMLLLWGGVLITTYFAVVLAGLPSMIPPWASFVPLLLLPIGAFISMRSFGETDFGAAYAIGRGAQLVLAAVILPSNPQYLSGTILLGGLVETCSFQAAQQMGDLKTAHITRTPPRAVFLAQLMGCVIGAILSPLVYTFYSSAISIPSKEFQVPEAYMWIVTSRLLSKKEMPPQALTFASAAFVIGLVLGLLRKFGDGKWWLRVVPSAVGLATGMYILPAAVVARAIGCLISVLCRKQLRLAETKITCLATGLILGQGVVDVLSLSAQLCSRLSASDSAQIPLQ